MPRSNLRLTKATRQNIIKNFELLPHQVLDMERHSLQLRLEDAKQQENELLALIDATNGQREFKHLLKTDLPKIQRLIERMKNEIDRVTHEIYYEHQLHLYKHDPCVFKHPKDTTDNPGSRSQAG